MNFMIENFMLTYKCIFSSIIHKIKIVVIMLPGHSELNHLHLKCCYSGSGKHW